MLARFHSTASWLQSAEAGNNRVPACTAELWFNSLQTAISPLLHVPLPLPIVSLFCDLLA